MTVRKKSDILCELLIRVLLAEPASLGNTVSPSDRNGAVGRAVSAGGCGRTSRSVKLDAICSVIVPFDRFVIKCEMLLCCDVDDAEGDDEDDEDKGVEVVAVAVNGAAVECEDAILTTVGIAVIDNGGGPLVDMASDTAVVAAAAGVDVEVD